ncbi:MAG: exodeoxyribonuclease V subunit beta [Mariprofundales bacterium]
MHGIKMVEASAGTGKTYAIGNLYLRMVLGGFTVDQILVVTFTKAATEELRGRIRQRIYQALHHLKSPSPASDDDEFLTLWTSTLLHDEKAQSTAKNSLKRALFSMDEAAIYTIHGFCQRALTEHAFHSQQPFAVEMISDDDALWQEALKDWWRIHTYPLNIEELAHFSNAVGSLDQLIALQKPLRKPKVTLTPCRAQWQALEAAILHLAKLWKKNRSMVDQALHSEALARRKTVYKLDHIPMLLDRLTRYFSSNMLRDVPHDDLNTIRASQLQSQIKKGKEEPLFDHPLFALVDEVATLAAAMPNNTLMDALERANTFAHRRVAQVKQHAQQMAYDDQLLQLEQALTNSSELVSAIQHHFPIAMIDEFQDTDAVQYSIFHQLYATANRGGLMMIGDPKQAIYGFRGGDIFAYMAAKQSIQHHYTLTTNWRSTPRLIAAVNQLFSVKSHPFIYQDIRFDPVQAADKTDTLLTLRGKEITPLTLWELPSSSDGKAINQANAMQILHQQTANEIARLLNDARDGALRLGDRAVVAGDIAVLVRGHHEATELREALRERGVGAVTANNHSVFDSEEATGLLPLLAAIIHCRDGMRLRQALTSTLLGKNYQAMHQSISDEAQWVAWSEQWSRLHDIWLRRGFIQAFQQLLRQLHIGERLAQTPQAERRLTNLLQLGELLQQASQSISGMEALLVWFTQQIAHPKQAGEEAEMRLENDRALVQIVTVHASKGLEYPIVFVPYLWTCKPRTLGKQLLSFYDKKRFLEAGSNLAHLHMAEKERLAEDVRLAYVALTRACAKVYLVWGHAGKDAKASALGWLLHTTQQAADLDQSQPDAAVSSASVTQALQTLHCASNGNIELHTLPLAPADIVTLTEHDCRGDALTPTPFSGTIAADWRIASFSSLTRDVHQNLSSAQQATTQQNHNNAAFNFPAGSQVGLFIHAMLETMDFQGDISSSVAAFVQQEGIRYGLQPDTHTAPLQQWMQTMLTTALNRDGLMLTAISTTQRLNELSFDFSITKLDIHKLNHLLNREANGQLQPLQASNCRGFVTGIIDLLFEHNGRYYIADYKSNHLGSSLEFYTPKRLQQAVWDRRYDLQYLIYTLALHRYLKLRIADYDYDTHIGGVYYLFLRGMCSEQGCRYGIHADRPSRTLIERLDLDLFRARTIASQP